MQEVFPKTFRRFALLFSWPTIGLVAPFGKRLFAGEGVMVHGLPFQIETDDLAQKDAAIGEDEAGKGYLAGRGNHLKWG